MKRFLLIFIIIAMGLTGLALIGSSFKAQHDQITRLKRIEAESLQTQKDTRHALDILVEATGPAAQKKSAAIITAFFKQLHQELQQGFASLSISAPGTVTVTRFVPVPGPTKTVFICKRKPC